MSGLGLTPITDGNRPGGPAAAPRTPLEAAKQRRAELAEAQTRDFPVPGYGDLPFGNGTGTLLARYRRLDVEDYQKALYGPAEDLVSRNAQFLINSLEDLCWQLSDDGETRTLPLSPDGPSGWHDYAEQVADDIPEDATLIDRLVDVVFAGNTLALADHAGDVGKWMEVGHHAADGAFLGGR